MTNNTRPPVIRAFLGVDEIVVDNFAGGGGASSGLARAIGRSPTIAINHDPVAIEMHRANHPDTEHLVEDVYKVDPVVACAGRPVGLAWFSPDCTHHSKAKGGKPRLKKIRGLAWVAVRWAAAVRPRIICLENVEEFRDWGPLLPTGLPDPARKGKTFRAFIRRLEKLGYDVEHRLLRACDYGAPTTRRRLFLVARCDSKPIRWPVASHGPMLALPYRTAAEIIDWSIPCPSIFDRARPLAEKTEARIARGIRKFVIEAARPFVLAVKTWGGGGNEPGSIDAPLRTITASKRGEFALVAPTLVRTAHGDVDKSGKRRGQGAHSVQLPLGTVCAGGTDFAIAVPYLVHRSNGERVGQAPRIYDPQLPLGTIVAQGQKHALCAAFLAKHYGGHESTKGGSGLDRSIDTITAQDHHSLVAAHLLRYNGERRDGEIRGVDPADPLPTQDTSNRFAQVLAFLARYNGRSGPQALDVPLGTLDTTDRYALVTVMIDGEEYVIVDIGMRMLSPRELFNAQGFDSDYRIDGAGLDLTKTAQVRMCGNSVPPPLAAAVGGAQLEAA